MNSPSRTAAGIAASFSVAGMICFAGCASPQTRAPDRPPAERALTVPSGIDVAVLPPIIFDGKTISGWAITDFAGHGEVKVENDRIILGMGAALTGLNWTNAAVLPKVDYEISLEAMKTDGSDFFCGLTFPVENSHCSFILGGWGGGLVGISSIEGMDASENETTRFYNFARDRWFHIRARVTHEKIEAWLDGDKVVNVEIAGRKISMRAGEIELSVPLGVATWQTAAAIRNVQLKKIQK